MARIGNSAEQKDARQTQGGLIDRFNNRLGWWERRTLAHRDDDYIVIVQVNEAGRPDLISNRAYGQDKYAWLVLQYNNIVDIAEELIVGAELVLPHQSRLLISILSQPVGGKLIT